MSHSPTVLTRSALDPSVRNDWADQMVSLLSPGGELVTVIYPIVEKVCMVYCGYTSYEELSGICLGIQMETVSIAGDDFTA